jgi:hypothetical protein
MKEVQIMKKYFLFAIILLTAGYSNAQITITAADFTAQLAVGHKVTSYANFSITSANIGSPGSTSWDFSSLVSESQFVTESKNKNSSTYSSDFPNAQYASYYEGTFSGVFSQSWVYNSIGPDYYIDGTGTFTSPSGINTTSNVSYTPKKKQYQLPIANNSTWNSSGTQTIKTTIVMPIIGNQITTVVQNYSSNYTVDAYGTVKMPGGKILSALRIKAVTSLTSNSQTTTTVNYIILTKTGESVSITVKDANATSGTVGINSISWTSGDGVSDPTGVEKTDWVPALFSLSQNYPNPFNPSTVISYQLSAISHVRLSVYDVVGREVATLVNEYKPAGIYAVNFDASKLSSGIYFYKLQTGNFTSTKKMVLMK